MPVKLPKETKAQIISDLSQAYGRTFLKCDGFNIALSVEKKAKGLSYHIAIYINGSMKGIWINESANHPETKFIFTHTRNKYTPAQKAKIKKHFGVRGTKKQFPDLDDKFEYLMPYINTANAAIAHLCKVCDSIELVDKNAAENELAAKAVADILEDIAK